MVNDEAIRKMMRKFKVRGFVAPAGWRSLDPSEIVDEYREVLGDRPLADLWVAVGSWLGDMVSAEVHIHRKIPTPEDLLSRMPGVAGDLRASRGQGMDWWALLQGALGSPDVAAACYFGGHREALIEAGLPADIVDVMSMAANACSTAIDGEYYAGWRAVQYGGSGQSSSRAAFIALFDCQARTRAEQGRPLAPIAAVAALLDHRRAMRLEARDMRLEARGALGAPVGRRELSAGEEAARDDRRRMLAADPVAGLRLLTGIGDE